MPDLLRRVIRIRAEDSPNVRREQARQRGEPEASWPAEVPGVVTWAEYRQRRATWDAVKQSVGLDARFWEGADALLFPPAWLDRAERIASDLRGKKRQAKGVGVDPGEGGADTSLAAVDDLGLIELVSVKTPDTDVVPGQVVAFLRRHGVDPESVCIDRGGGGKQHADRLRAMGYPVRTVAFGEALQAPGRGGGDEERLDHREQRYAYVNRRAQMYGETRLILDPTGSVDGIGGPAGWGIPAEYQELRRQLAPIPLTYDPEGRLKLPPKHARGPGDRTVTLASLIGRSPDDADALVLAVHAMLHPEESVVVGLL